MSRSLTIPSSAVLLTPGVFLGGGGGLSLWSHSLLLRLKKDTPLKKKPNSFLIPWFYEFNSGPAKESCSSCNSSLVSTHLRAKALALDP